MKKTLSLFIVLSTFFVQAQVRRNINSYTATERSTLAGLMMDYISAAVVEDHCVHQMITGGHIHSDFDFLPFHRIYLEGMEDFLIKNGYPQFVPLPKWDPAGAVPNELRVVDPNCGDAACDAAHPASSCGSPVNWTPAQTLPVFLTLPVKPGVNNDICDWNMNPTSPTAPGLPDCCPTGLSREIENPYHNPVHGAMGGVMGNFRSPALPIFWLWHAFVDDLWKSWECTCPQSTTKPVDLWMKDNHKIVQSERDRGEEPNIDTDPMWISKDIWVRNQPDGVANQNSENPEYQSGQPVFVYVRVRNRGCSPSLGTEQIRLNWAKANTDLSWPANWNGSSVFSNGQLMGNLIATKTITTPIAAGGQQIIEFAWFPPNPDDYAVVTPEPWHFCLLARIEATNDPMTFVETTDVNANTKNNNNIVWKNISIVNNIPGISIGPEGEILCDKLIESIGVAAVVTNPSSQKEIFDITFKVPETDLGHCDKLNCPYINEKTTMVIDVFGVPKTIVVSNIHGKHQTPITREGTVVLAMDKKLYDKWVLGGKMGTGFIEMGQSACHNLTNPVPPIATDKKLFQLTCATADFQNISFNSKEALPATLLVLYPITPVSAKKEFKYDIIQKKNSNKKIVGGVRYELKKPNCLQKGVGAGLDQTIDKGCSANLHAAPNLDCANYWWLNQNGTIIAQNAAVAVAPLITQTYTLKTVSPEGCISQDQVKVNVTSYNCSITGGRINSNNTSDLNNKEIFSIAPNPATEFVKVNYNIENFKTAYISILRADLSEVKTVRLNAETTEMQIGISECAPGLYIVNLIGDGLVIAKKTLVVVK